eukprot:3941581-Rhodomonas_salina.1
MRSFSESKLCCWDERSSMVQQPAFAAALNICCRLPNTFAMQQQLRFCCNRLLAVIVYWNPTVTGGGAGQGGC